MVLAVNAQLRRPPHGMLSGGCGLWRSFVHAKEPLGSLFKAKSM